MEPVRFSTQDGVSLEGEIRRPEGAAIGTSVLCHAHPRRGGSKDHPILWALRNELASRGSVVLAFNFRGTMGSAGTYAGGHAEIKDVDAAVTRARTEADGATLVCGWSFGASLALREALTDDRVAGLALVGLPLEPDDLEIPPIPGRAELRTFRRPVLLIAGEGDIYCPRPRLETLGATMPTAEVVIVPGTDHFLWRREKAVAETVGAFATRLFG
jgi:uncharacterized protein